MFYAPYFNGQYFTPVWFAPGDETAVPPEELHQGGGTPVKVKARKKPRPAWVIPPQFAKPRPRQVENDEALMLADVI